MVLFRTFFEPLKNTESVITGIYKKTKIIIPIILLMTNTISTKELLELFEPY